MRRAEAKVKQADEESEFKRQQKLELRRARKALKKARPDQLHELQPYPVEGQEVVRSVEPAGQLGCIDCRHLLVPCSCDPFSFSFPDPEDNGDLTSADIGRMHQTDACQPEEIDACSTLQELGQASSRDVTKDDGQPATLSKRAQKRLRKEVAKRKAEDQPAPLSKRAQKRQRKEAAERAAEELVARDAHGMSAQKNHTIQPAEPTQQPFALSDVVSLWDIRPESPGKPSDLHTILASTTKTASSNSRASAQRTRCAKHIRKKRP